jgi:hypothetical protein
MIIKVKNVVISNAKTLNLNINKRYETGNNNFKNDYQFKIILDCLIQFAQHECLLKIKVLGQQLICSKLYCTTRNNNVYNVVQPMSDFYAR